MVMTGQPVFMLLLWDFLQVAGTSRPTWKRSFMWGAPWDGWRTATTEGGGRPLCGQEGELRTSVQQQGSQPLAGQPGKGRKCWPEVSSPTKALWCHLLELVINRDPYIQFQLHVLSIGLCLYSFAWLTVQNNSYLSYTGLRSSCLKQAIYLQPSRFLTIYPIRFAEGLELIPDVIGWETSLSQG